jgi:dTDP-4-amino-4,6-dideoxygalactose transaminase
MVVSSHDKLALLGGAPVITRPRPHEIWPPAADDSELADLAAQRNTDISIRGRSGPIKVFEESFLDFMERRVQFAVTFNSGTSALLAAYFALGVDEGAEVIGPVLTYHAAMSPIFILRGTPVLVDIDRRSRCIDPERIEEAITPRTRLITVVHQWGHPADMDRILEIASRHRLPVLEDCSHAHGSRYKGRLCGTFGDAAVFSLQANKMVFAGDGGVLVTSDPDVHARATLLGHYRDRSRDEITDAQYRQFWVTGFGLKLRMSPFDAVVATHSLRAFPKRREGRYQCLRYFGERLEELGFFEATAPPADNDMGAWYGFKPLYREELLGHIKRETFIRALQAEGLEIDVPSGPLLSTLPLYAADHDPLFPRGG